MLAPIAAGASLATLPKFDPEAVLTVASTLKCDTLLMCRRCIALSRACRTAAAGIEIRLAISARKRCPAKSRALRKSFRRAAAGRLRADGDVAGDFIQHAWANKPGTVGVPIKDVKVRSPMPRRSKNFREYDGESGSAPNVMKGYRNRPERDRQCAHRRRLAPDWRHGRIDNGWIIRITAACGNDQSAGEMVFPAEVEHAC